MPAPDSPRRRLAIDPHFARRRGVFSSFLPISVATPAAPLPGVRVYPIGSTLCAAHRCSMTCAKPVARYGFNQLTDFLRTNALDEKRHRVAGDLVAANQATFGIVAPQLRRGERQDTSARAA